MMVGHIILNELKIWRSIGFKHLFVGRSKGSSRNDGRLCIHGGVKELLCTPRTIMVECRDFGIGSREAYWTLGRSALYLFAQKCRAMVES